VAQKPKSETHWKPGGKDIRRSRANGAVRVIRDLRLLRPQMDETGHDAGRDAPHPRGRSTMQLGRNELPYTKPLKQLLNLHRSGPGAGVPKKTSASSSQFLRIRSRRKNCWGLGTHCPLAGGRGQPSEQAGQARLSRKMRFQTRPSPQTSARALGADREGKLVTSSPNT